MTWAEAAVSVGVALYEAAAPTLTPTAASRAGPTFCAEWILQTKEGYERLTLFADRTLVWKTSRDGKEDTRRKTIPADETDFYCQYFARDEFFALPRIERAVRKDNPSARFGQADSGIEKLPLKRCKLGDVGKPY